MIRLFGHLFAPDDRGLCVVSVDGRVVSAIEPAAGAPDGSVGGPSYRIVPGLIDIQVNGAFGDDFADPRADLARIRREMPRFGVTAFVPTIVTSPPEAYAPALANLRASSRPGEARVPGVHIEGPYISPRHKGTHDPAQLRLPDRREVESWLEAGDVSWLTLAPELPGALPLIELLADRGVRVSVGHTDATWTEAAAAERAGATMATHLFNAMRPLRHRDPGVVGYVLASGLLAGFMADGRHLAFETIRLLARIKAPDELFLVTDALAGLGMPPGRYVLAGREYVSDGVTGHLPDGTLSGSLLPMDRAVRNLVVEAGLPPPVAIALATRNPARALGLEGLGRIAVGGPADLVLLGPDWRVDRTYVAGELAYDAETGAPEAGQVGAVR